ncbi:MAG: hypothetical protein IJU56_07855 [Clostridia bacterium]|nr:hypothetical protein [Clostridia bacterium]
MKKTGKVFDVLTIFVGLLFIAAGVYLFLIGNDHNPSGSGLIKASTSIQFGADFYTTSAQYTGLAANVLVDLFDLVRYAFSACFVLSGLLIDCRAGKALTKEKNKKTKLTNVPVQTTSMNSSVFPAPIYHGAEGSIQQPKQ